MFTELPEKFGPILVKEIRQGLRRSLFVYSFLSIQSLAILALVAEFILDYTQPDEIPRLLQWDVPNTGYFWWLVIAVCGFLMPLAGTFMMTEELNEGNHEILQMAQTNRWQIVRGKFLVLWGLSALTLVSLLPYMIVRYFLGGMDWVRELTNIGTVLCTAALVSAISLAVSGFENIPAKLGIAAMYIFTTPLGILIGLSGGLLTISATENTSAALLGPIYYNLAAITGVITFVISALLIARSRLRLAVMAFELKPSSTIIVLTAISPFFIGIVTMFTCGYGSILGTISFLLLVWNTDVTPKAHKTKPPQLPNTPAVSKGNG